MKLILALSWGVAAVIAPAPPNVTAHHPVEESVTPYLDLTGTAAASQSVDLVARVPGYLQTASFKDGDPVAANQVLFVIEPEPYQQQLALQEAALERAQAEYDRQLGLLKENATSTADVEQWRSSRDQAKAQVELAKINLGYTRVTAPFAGRIGRRLVDPGNMVGSGSVTKLATLDQLAPIYIYFNLNERDALRIREALKKHGLDPRSAVGKVPVLFGLQNERDFPHSGTFDFADIGFSSSTGTIELRATYKNEDQLLVPGAFVRARIPVGQPQPLPVVPGCAVGNDQEGDYVLVVEPNDVVARRAVVKGPNVPHGCAITSGVETQDVVVSGFANARSGQKVSVQGAPAN